MSEAESQAVPAPRQVQQQHVQQPPPQSATISDPRWALASDAWNWGKNQHPAWLTLWAVLLVIGGGGYFSVRYIVNTAVPAHLASIKAGYEELWQKHLDDKKTSEATHREHLDQVVAEMRNSNRLMDSLVREFILREQRREQADAAGPNGAIPNGTIPRPGGG